MISHDTYTRVGTATSVVAVSPPAEPDLSTVAGELLGYVSRAEQLLDAYMECVYGQGQGPQAVRIDSTSLDSTMRRCCERVASICGNLATINARIGAKPL